MRDRNLRFDDDVNHLIRIWKFHKQVSTDGRYGVILKDGKQSWVVISTHMLANILIQFWEALGDKPVSQTLCL